MPDFETDTTLRDLWGEDKPVEHKSTDFEVKWPEMKEDNIVINSQTDIEGER